MNNIDKSYLYGFVKKANEYGYTDKQAVALLKSANTVPGRIPSPMGHPLISGNDAAYIQQPKRTSQEASASYLQHSASPLRQLTGVNTPYPGSSRPDAVRPGWTGESVPVGNHNLMGQAKLHLGDANPAQMNPLGYNHAGVANEMMQNQAAHMGGPGAAYLGNMQAINSMSPR
jgi:hypothetical protein